MTFRKYVDNVGEWYMKLRYKPFYRILRKMYRKYNLYYFNNNKDKIVIKKIDGINYRLNLGELIDNSMYNKGYFEKNTTNAIKKLCKREMVIFDIGANVGIHALRMAKQVGPKGKIYAFEPMSWAQKKFKSNHLLNNNLNNIVLEKLALGEKEISITTKFRTSWQLSGNQNKQSLHTEKINFKTLDSYVKEKKIKRLDFMKIDVDGGEYSMVLGAKKAIKKFMPKIILEVSEYQDERKYDVAKFLSIFKDLGYSFYSEENFKKFRSVSQIAKITKERRSINLILINKNEKNPFS
ncbi:MAG: FkbM family methyltransferase [Candidatus Woesearchaeota archaeon]